VTKDGHDDRLPEEIASAELHRPGNPEYQRMLNRIADYWKVSRSQLHKLNWGQWYTAMQALGYPLTHEQRKMLGRGGY
jgi:hypothetical protein